MKASRFQSAVGRSLTSLLMLVLATQVLAAPSAHFQTSTPSVYGNAGRLRVALPITNVGNASATDVTVSTVTLAGVGPTDVINPSLGVVAVGTQAVLEADFVAPSVPKGSFLLMRISGTYRLGGAKLGFSLNRQVVTPPPADGSGSLTLVPVAPRRTPCLAGPCTPLTGGAKPFVPAEVNAPGPPVPTGKFILPVKSFMTPRPAPAPAVGFGGSGGIYFNQTTPDAPNPTSLYSGIPPDSSGASSTVCRGDLFQTCTDLVLMTGNTFLAWSTDGGKTFPTNQIVRPGNVYSDTPDGGFCCDQIVQYVPSIDRYIWLIQTNRSATGPNRERIAVASPASIVSSGALAWTYYDLTSATFGLGTNWVDYPDLAVGNNFLYVSMDSVGVGLIVARIPLADLAAGANTTIGYTTPSDGASAYGGHLSQNALDGVYWAGHNTSSNIRVFRMPEGDTRYFWQSFDVRSWANTNFATTDPDNLDWLSFGFPRSSVMGAVRRSQQNDIWLAWSAGRDATFAQPHIELLNLQRNADGSVSTNGQFQVWNSNLAFQYPALSTDTGGDLAIALGWGGGPDGHYASFAVGFWGDFVVYYMDPSTLTAAYDVSSNAVPPVVTNQPRWGDFVSVRSAGSQLSTVQFTGFGYAVKTDVNNRDGCKTVLGTSTGCRFEPQFVRFEYRATIQ
jgi:hypothetical protein